MVEHCSNCVVVNLERVNIEKLHYIKLARKQNFHYHNTNYLLSTQEIVQGTVCTVLGCYNVTIYLNRHILYLYSYVQELVDRRSPEDYTLSMDTESTDLNNGIKSKVSTTDSTPEQWLHSVHSLHIHT